MSSMQIGGGGGLRNLGGDEPLGVDVGQAAAQEAVGTPVFSRMPTSGRPLVGVSSVAPSAQSAASEATVRAFYEAFTHLRWDEVDALYAKDLSYKDPLFAHKDSASAIHMWRTLFQAENLKMGYEMLSAEGDTVRGRWTADYDFHGRKVHEVSESTFTVKDGKIVRHEDDFSVVAWAKQALPLGPLAALADTTIGRAVITRLMRFGIDLAEEKLREKDAAAPR